MKLAMRRIPFVLMVAIGGSYVLLRAILPILSPFHVDIEIHNAVVFWYFADRAAFWITLAASFMIWRKGITRRYLRGNQAQLENVCQQLSAIPIRYLGTTLPAEIPGAGAPNRSIVFRSGEERTGGLRCKGR